MASVCVTLPSSFTDSCSSDFATSPALDRNLETSSLFSARALEKVSAFLNVFETVTLLVSTNPSNVFMTCSVRTAMLLTRARRSDRAAGSPSMLGMEALGSLEARRDVAVGVPPSNCTKAPPERPRIPIVALVSLLIGVVELTRV